MLYRFDSMEGKIAALQHTTPVSTPLPVEESCLAMSSFVNSCDAYGRIYHWASSWDNYATNTAANVSLARV